MARGISLEFDRAWTPDYAGVGVGHPGVSVLPGGEVLVGSPDSGDLLFLDDEGRISRRVQTAAVEAHCLVNGRLDGRAVIWIADPGFRVVTSGGELRADRESHGRVFAIDLTGGAELAELPLPATPVYDRSPYRPTSIAVVPVAGRVEYWVADGYGASVVHRFDDRLRLVAALAGARHGHRFDCPHALHVHHRHGTPEVYVADRGNRQIHVLGVDGSFLRTLRHDGLTSPSAFASFGGRLLVGELRARILVLDADEEVEASLGAGEACAGRPGWPNRIGSTGRLTRPTLGAGELNSPHALAADPRGYVYVTEYVLGGRLYRLRLVAAAHGSTVRRRR